MEGDGRVQCEKRVRGIHESLLLVRLKGEDSQPSVKRSDKGNCPKQCLFGSGMGSKESLQNKQWRRRYCQDEPSIEVQQQISDIEGPRLRAEDIGAPTFAPEDIVRHDVPRHDGELAKEQRINSDCHSLRKLVHHGYLPRKSKCKPTKVNRHLSIPSAIL